MKFYHPIIRRVLTALARFSSVFVVPFFINRGEFADSRRGGNVRRNVIASFVCGIFFASPFVVQDAAAFGSAYFVGGNWYISTNYTNDAAAQAAAVQACIDAGVVNTNDCNSGTDHNGFNNQVVIAATNVADNFPSLFIQRRRGENALAAAIALCESDSSPSLDATMCEAAIMATSKTCGDGNRFLDTNDCDVVSPTTDAACRRMREGSPPLPLALDLNDNTKCVTLTEEHCFAPYGDSFHNGRCVEECPATLLGMNAGDNTCIATTAPDCTGTFFDDTRTRCVSSCPPERVGVAADGITCVATTASDCTAPDLDFFDNDRCVAECPPERFGIDADGMCTTTIVTDCTAERGLDFLDGGSCVAECPPERFGADADGMCTTTIATDCTAERGLDFFDGGSCVAECPPERFGADADGTCRTTIATDCTAERGLDFFDGGPCIEACPPERLGVDSDGSTCTTTTAAACINLIDTTLNQNLPLIDRVLPFFDGGLCHRACPFTKAGIVTNGEEQTCTQTTEAICRAMGDPPYGRGGLGTFAQKLVGGICVPLTAADCTEPNLGFFFNPNCVEVCPATHIKIDTADGKTCLVTTADQCAPETETFDGVICNPTVEADCSATQTFDVDRCRPAVASDCTDPNALFFDVDRCVQECSLEKFDTTADGVTCSPTIPANCTGDLIFDFDRCRATAKEDCFIVQTFDLNECRPTVASDCIDPNFSDPDLLFFDNQRCVQECPPERFNINIDDVTCEPTIPSDCRGQTTFNVDRCVPTTGDLCDADEIFVGGGCRLTESSDCTGLNALFFDRGICVQECPPIRFGINAADGKTCQLPQSEANCPGGELTFDDGTGDNARFSTPHCRATVATDCTEDTGLEYFDNDVCVNVCPLERFGKIPTPDGNTCNPTSPADCTRELTFNVDRCRPTVEADCSIDQSFDDLDVFDGTDDPNGTPDANIHFAGTKRGQCRTLGIPISNVYVAATCEGAGWEIEERGDGGDTGVGGDTDVTNRFAELCNVPYRVAAIESAGEVQTRQVAASDAGENCIMRMADDFEVGRISPVPVRCNDPGLFGENGFPLKPAGFESFDQLIVSRAADSNTPNRITFSDYEVPRHGSEIPTLSGPAPSPITGGVDNAAELSNQQQTNGDCGFSCAGYVGGGLLAAFSLYYLITGDDEEFAFAPSYGYSANDSGYSYNYGGRMDFNNAHWNIYWTATQANANGNTGDLRYGSGGSYKADFWTATFAESISGKTADYDFALSADYNGGIWQVSPVYRLQTHFEEDGESETENALNLEAVLQWNRWKVSPSAGFRWENAKDFGDNAKFGLSVVREF